MYTKLTTISCLAAAALALRIETQSSATIESGISALSTCDASCGPCCCDNPCDEDSEPEEDSVQVLIPEISEDATLEEIVASAEGHPLVLDFMYYDCQPCHDFESDYHKLIEANPNVLFRPIEYVEHKFDIWKQLNITDVPAFKIFVNGELQNSVQGADKDLLEDYVADAIDSYRGENDSD